MVHWYWGTKNKMMIIYVFNRTKLDYCSYIDINNYKGYGWLNCCYISTDLLISAAAARIIWTIVVFQPTFSFRLF
jgi:hypothetical protein